MYYPTTIRQQKDVDSVAICYLIAKERNVHTCLFMSTFVSNMSVPLSDDSLPKTDTLQTTADNFKNPAQLYHN